MKIKYLILGLVISIVSGLALAWLSFGGPAGSGLLSSSSATEKITITKVISGYLKAWSDEKPDLMYDYLATGDKLRIAKAEYIAQYQKFPIKPLAYTVKNINFLDDTNANAIVHVSWPDVGMDTALEKDETFSLTKEGNGWRVREDASLSK